MTTIIIIIFFILFINLLPLRKKTKLITTFLILLFISCYRTPNFGVDIPDYIEKYQLLKYSSFQKLIYNTVSNVGKDPFFYLVIKVIGEISNYSNQFLLSALSTFFLLPFLALFQKLSSNYFLPTLILIAMYLPFSFSGLRQALAISIAITAIYFLLEREKQLSKYILLIILASMFHSSALILLFLPIIGSRKLRLWQIILLLVSPFVLSQTNIVYEIVSFMTKFDARYMSYLEPSKLNWTGYFIQLSFVLLVLHNYKKSSNQNYVLLVNSMMLGLAFQAFSSQIAEFFRVSMYFSIVSVVTVPISISSLTNRNLRFFIKIAVITFLILFLLQSNQYQGFELMFR